MARSSNQKLKLLYLAQYFLKYTDEHHPVSVRDLIGFLEQQDISAERKSLYDDIDALRTFGLDIIQQKQARSTVYYLGSRDFELPELKLMVDSIQTSKFVTEKKTLALIKKIEGLTSCYEAQLLQKQVYLSSGIKHMNEAIYYHIDKICTAIFQDRKIQFHYFDYTVRKERHIRRDGAFYLVSPFALIWDDENYYLVAYDSDAAQIKHYRVDKMLDLSVTEESREGQEAYEQVDIGLYAKRVFSMFTGKTEMVRLRFENHLVGAVLDRFGQDVILASDGNEHFRIQVEVTVSPQFFAWIFAFGSGAEILGPDYVAEEMRTQLEAVLRQYDHHGQS